MDFIFRRCSVDYKKLNGVMRREQRASVDFLRQDRGKCSGEPRTDESVQTSTLGTKTGPRQNSSEFLFALSRLAQTLKMPPATW